MPKTQSRATMFVREQLGEAKPELQVVEDSKPDENRVVPKPAKKPPAQKKVPNRLELPKKELSHRVRVDIHGRIDDEDYRRKKSGNRTPLADIVDEALHLGLLQIEKRNRQAEN